MTKYPAGYCYRNVIMWAIDNLRPDLRIVHGTVVSVGKSRGHAWLEFGNSVHDPTLGQRFDRAIYYATYWVTDAHVYTVNEACETGKAAGHFGPWH